MKQNVKESLEIILKNYKNDNLTTEEVITLLDCLEDNKIYSYTIPVYQPHQWTNEQTPKPITPMWQTTSCDTLLNNVAK